MKFTSSRWLILFFWQIFLWGMMSPAVAQPPNDSACNATYIGHLDANTRFLSIQGTNVGATVQGETSTEDPEGIVLEPSPGEFPSCKGSNPWRNTVWFYYTYDYPFHKISTQNLISISGTFNYTLFLSQNLCEFRENVPITFSPPGNCGIAPGQNAGYGLGCFDGFANFPSSEVGTLYILVSSDSDAEEGEFELEIRLPEPTFCNSCQDQNESAVDDVFAIDNVSTTEATAGLTDGSIEVGSVTGGKLPLEYSVDGTLFQPDGLFENLATGEYTVTVRDANGCIITRTVTIEEVLPEQPIITPPDLVCEGESQTVSAVGINIRWYSDAALTQLVAEGNEFSFSAGTFTTLYATQTANDVESEASSVTIGFIDVPELSVQTDGDACSTTFTAVLSPSAAASYQWFLNGQPIADATEPSLTSVGAGTYHVEITYQTCVIRSDDFPLTGEIPAVPTVTPPPIYCEGDVIAPLQASSNGEIVWYTDATLTQELARGAAFTPENLTETATFYAQAVLGECTSEVASVTLTINPRPAATIQTDGAACVGTPLTAQSNFPDVTFDWFLDGEALNENSTTFTPTAPGEYQVVVSREGCTQASEVIRVEEVPNRSTILSETTFCNTVPSITLEAQSNFPIRWYADANLSELINEGNTFTTTEITSQSFWLQAVNGGCVSEATELRLLVLSAPVVQIEVSEACVGNLMTATLSNPEASLQWFADGIAIPEATSTTLMPAAAGTYQVEAILNGCSSRSNEIEIEAYPTVPEVATVPAYCEGDVIAPLQATSTGEIVWYADATLTQELARGAAFMPENLTETATFWLQATNNGCLSDTASVTVEIFPIPTAAVTTQTRFCLGEALFAQTDAADATYQWFLDGQPISEATTSTLLPEVVGQYSVRIQRGNCTTISEPVQINPIPQADAGTDQLICLGDPVTLSVQNPLRNLTYEWYDGNRNLLESDPELTLTPTDSARYVLIATDSNGCFARDEVIVRVEDAPLQAGFEVDYLVGYAPLSVQFTDQSVAADSVIWDFADGTTSTERNPAHTFEEVGDYEVLQTVQVNEVCTDTTTLRIRVIEPLNIPTGISPNGDGANDTWIIDNISLFPENRIRVFNQWGNLVYEVENYQNDWQGDNLPDATYFFVIELQENIPAVKGYLMILR